MAFIFTLVASVIVVTMISLFTAKKQYLAAFYVLCYSVSFFGLLSCLWSDTVVFWPIGDYTFSDSSDAAERLAAIWCLGSLGMFFSFFITRRQYPALVVGVAREFGKRGDIFKGVCFFFVVSAFLIAFRLVDPDRLASMLAGIESLIVFSILCVCAYGLAYPSRGIFIASGFLIIAYSIANALTGDRDFVVLVAAFVLGIMFRYREIVTVKLLLMIAAAMVVVLGLGVYVSMIRMNEVFSENNILKFFMFNSWNAIILPLVAQVTSFWDGGHLRFGSTYLDMILSMAPSPVYSLFGLEKPILADNPAMWYYITGLGGIHAAGVAFENFGLVGVFLNTLITLVFFGMVESVVRNNSFFRYLLYLVCASAVMHSLWYGEIYLLNALVFFIMAMVFFGMIIFIRQLSVRFLGLKVRE